VTVAISRRFEILSNAEEYNVGKIKIESLCNTRQRIKNETAKMN